MTTPPRKPYRYKTPEIPEGVPTTKGATGSSSAGEKMAVDIGIDAKRRLRQGRTDARETRKPNNKCKSKPDPAINKNTQPPSRISKAKAASPRIKERPPRMKEKPPRYCNSDEGGPTKRCGRMKGAKRVRPRRAKTQSSHSRSRINHPS